MYVDRLTGPSDVIMITFQPKTIIFKMQVALICLNLIKGKQLYTLLPTFNMNIMIFFNLVYKIK